MEEVARRRGRVRGKRDTMKGKKEVRWKEKENGSEGYGEICDKRGSLKGRGGTKEETEDNVFFISILTKVARIELVQIAGIVLLQGEVI